MSDEFAGQRLPDLPNAGYATQREKALTDEIMFFIRGCERNRKLLLTIIRDGKDKFRKTGRKAWAHLRVDTEACDAVYDALIATAFPAYALEHGDRRAWDYGRMRSDAGLALAQLEAYEAQTMAQRIHDDQTRLIREFHSKTRH